MFNIKVKVCNPTLEKVREQREITFTENIVYHQVLNA